MQCQVTLQNGSLRRWQFSRVLPCLRKQLEQQNDDIVFDRAWMLDAYAECLEAAQGKRSRKGPEEKAPPARSRKP